MIGWCVRSRVRRAWNQLTRLCCHRTSLTERICVYVCVIQTQCDKDRETLPCSWISMGFLVSLKHFKLLFVHRQEKVNWLISPVERLALIYYNLWFFLLLLLFNPIKLCFIFICLYKWSMNIYTFTALIQNLSCNWSI
jgi:hypothetical protein